MDSFFVAVCCLTLGVVLRRLGRLPQGADRCVAGVVIQLSAPAVCFSAARTMPISAEMLLPASMAWVVFAGAAVFFGLLRRPLGLSRETFGCLMLTAGISNAIFIGLPMIEACYGHELTYVAFLCDSPGTSLVLALPGVLLAAHLSPLGRKNMGKGERVRQALMRVAAFPPFRPCCGGWRCAAWRCGLAACRCSAHRHDAGAAVPAGRGPRPLHQAPARGQPRPWPWPWSTSSCSPRFSCWEWPYSASPTPVWWRRSPYSKPPCRPWSWGAYWPPRTAWTGVGGDCRQPGHGPVLRHPAPVAAGPFCLVKPNEHSVTNLIFLLRQESYGMEEGAAARPPRQFAGSQRPTLRHSPGNRECPRSLAAGPVPHRAPATQGPQARRTSPRRRPATARKEPKAASRPGPDPCRKTGRRARSTRAVAKP